MSRPNALPRYVQISEMLIRDIQAGRLLPGERLPPERDMAASHGISVGTLRKALADLAEKGMLERVQGSGNYVRDTGGGDSVYAFFRLELIGGGGLPTAEVLSVDTLPKPAEGPRFGRDAMGHRIRRLRRLNDIPAALEEIWLDAGYAPALDPDALSESLYFFYRTRLGLWIQRAEDRIGLAPVPDWAGPAFPLPPGRTAGFVERISWDTEGQSAERSATWFNSDVCRYVSRLK